MSATNRFADCDDPSEGAADPGRESAATDQGKGPAAVQQLLDELRALRAQIGLLLSAKVDGAKLGLRRLLFSLALAVIGAIMAATCLIVATALVIVGLGDGLGLWLEQPWLGRLLVGAIFLLSMATAIYLVLRSLTRVSYRRTVEKYAQRRQQPIVRSGRELDPQPEDSFVRS